ncbi:hypothetical protein [Curtobacterium pusillum]|uniref:hypothetical protein n=1 Tax=Curtobacterium pusillum TaxID=69373 RepID=UPI0011A1E665|nr:hypothetical protein [Curtobacterium pusillum]
MKHRPSCRTAALITAATGTVLVTSAFGIVPAMAVTASPEAVTSTSTSAPADTVAAPATPTPSADTTASAPEPSTAATPSTPTAPEPAAPAATTAPTLTTPAAPAAPAATTTAPTTAGRQPTSSTTTGRTPTSRPSTPGHGDDHRPAPTYSSTSSQSAPVVLPTVQAGEQFTADLRAQHADGATYTLTTVEGGAVVLPEGLSFRHGILSGVPTTSGTFTALVTATNDCGSASQWIRITVEPTEAAHLGAAVYSVPAASDGSYTWVAPDGTTAPAPIRVDEDGSITVVPWAFDANWNRVDVSDVVQLTSDQETDVIVPTDGGFTVTFPHASPHILTLTVDCVSVTFAVEVVDTTPTTTPTEPTTPTTPATPVTPTTPVSEPDVPTQVVALPTEVRITQTTSGALTPVATSDPVATADQLAYTGADTTTPIGWAAGLLAAGAALLGIRRLRRSRHRA